MNRDLPSILVPYKNPVPGDPTMDVFLYLRPETNGMRVESSILRAIRSNPGYHTNIELVYLANVPGRFILNNHIIEEHYATRLHFAALGGEAFTASMRQRFEAYFQVAFSDVHVLGAFDAMRELNLSMEELFSLWVEPFNVLVLNGQSIKRKGDVFVVNYDIPALLHKNTYTTDIAVMAFRFDFSWDELRKLMKNVAETLTADGILDPTQPPDRVFHHSRGPFEQIVDARGYLYDCQCARIPLEQVSFCRYLLERGVGINEVNDILSNPIRTFSAKHGSIEDNILTYTMYGTYEDAFEKFRSVESHVLSE